MKQHKRKLDELGRRAGAADVRYCVCWCVPGDCEEDCVCKCHQADDDTIVVIWPEDDKPMHPATATQGR